MFRNTLLTQIVRGAKKKVADAEQPTSNDIVNIFKDRPDPVRFALTENQIIARVPSLAARTLGSPTYHAGGWNGLAHQWRADRILIHHQMPSARHVTRLIKTVKKERLTLNNYIKTETDLNPKGDKEDPYELKDIFAPK